MTDQDIPAQQANDENAPGAVTDDQATRDHARAWAAGDETHKGEAEESEAPPAFPDQPAEARGGEPLDHA